MVRHRGETLEVLEQRARAPMRPMLRTGWRTVVSPTASATVWSSNPITETSCPAVRPVSRSAWSTPNAISSLIAKIAVGRTDIESNADRGSSAALDGETAVDDVRLLQRRAMGRECRAKAGRPIGGHVAGIARERPSADHRDAPMAELQQVVRGHRRAGDVVDRDGRDGVEFLTEHDDRYVEVGKAHGALLAAHDVDEQHAVDPLAEAGLAGQQSIAVGRVGRRDEQVVAVLGEDVLDTGDHLGGVPAGEHRGEQRDGVRMAGPRRAAFGLAM